MTLMTQMPPSTGVIGRSKPFIDEKRAHMRDWSEEELSIGKVERAVLRYLYEDGEREAKRIRYEIIRVDRFESPSAHEAGTIFAVVVKERFTLPQHKEEHTMLGVLLATFQEDRSLKISAPIMSAHLGCL
jgi:hypothetical protein